MEALNIGILAHVDAGKTSLTERLLFEAGVIDEPGSVDRGSTRTDSMELERRRGITIRSAVVSFEIDGQPVNLIDTPGHSDFIAEVERALGVLDAAVLVVSAVEGVQAQTRILMRTLSRLRIPTVLFVNKIDRAGARYDELLDAVARKLTGGGIALSSVSAIGTRAAKVHPFSFADPGFADRLTERLAERSESFLDRYLADDRSIDPAACRAELVAQTAEAVVQPILFGSAITGEGVDHLIRELRELFPVTGANGAGADLAGSVFKIERGAAGEKVAYVRLHAGELAVRTQVPYYRWTAAGVREHREKVTAMRVFRGAEPTAVERAGAGSIVQVWGLREIRIGDRLGTPGESPGDAAFSPPALEAVAEPVDPARRPALYDALRQLSEQDPLIGVRRDEAKHEITVRLYGEVQKEVLAAQLDGDFGVAVRFAETQTVYLEKPVGVGSALTEIAKRERNEFYATIGLEVAPAGPGSGVAYRLGVELGSLPLAFHTAIEDSVYEGLRHGPQGWAVTDCQVTLTHSGFASPISTAGDFRKLTLLVLETALRRAGTRLYEPINRFEAEVPPDTISAVLAKLAELGATPAETRVLSDVCYLEGAIPVRQVAEFERRLPALTRGEGVFLSRPSGYRAVSG
ncbi:elongation factor G [Amycolatopsis nigrescens]|uniref:elongation factor G n=1 Tax=Amycolatopsis nigrescens TaxID=381445 RepID=UPI00036825CD|nr:TetM/TetW/TetO/TetS family tetracycline resistance ribosomal protection protein [Amycolatopsis nigrescens]